MLKYHENLRSVADATAFWTGPIQAGHFRKTQGAIGGQFERFLSKRKLQMHSDMKLRELGTQCRERCRKPRLSPRQKEGRLRWTLRQTITCRRNSNSWIPRQFRSRKKMSYVFLDGKKCGFFRTMGTSPLQMLKRWFLWGNNLFRWDRKAPLLAEETFFNFLELIW